MVIKEEKETVRSNLERKWNNDNLYTPSLKKHALERLYYQDGLASGYSDRSEGGRPCPNLLGVGADYIILVWTPAVLATGFVRHHALSSHNHYLSKNLEITRDYHPR